MLLPDQVDARQSQREGGRIGRVTEAVGARLIAHLDLEGGCLLIGNDVEGHHGFDATSRLSFGEMETLVRGFVLAGVTIAEPVLFGRIIDAIASKDDVVENLAFWAGLGAFNIIAYVLVARGADECQQRETRAQERPASGTRTMQGRNGARC